MGSIIEHVHMWCRIYWAHRRCPVVAPEERHPVKGTGAHLEDQGLVGEDHPLDLSFWLHPEAWSTWAGPGKRQQNLQHTPRSFWRC